MPSRRLPKRWSPTPVRTTVLPAAEADREAEAAELLSVRAQIAELHRRLGHLTQAQLAADRQSGAQQAPIQPTRVQQARAFRPMVPLVVASPYESVQVAFVDGADLDSGVQDSGMEPLLEHALDVADADGVLWTPLLDSMAATVWRDQVQHPDIRLRRLAPWIASQTSEDPLAPLRAFRSGPLGYVLASNLPGALLSDAWTDWALNSPTSRAIRALWGNVAFSTSQREAMLDRTVSVLVASVGKARIAIHRNAETLVLAALGSREHQLTPGQVGLLARAALDSEQGVATPEAQGAGLVDTLLIRNPSTPETVLRDLLRRDPEGYTHHDMARHPNAPLDHLRDVTRFRTDHWDSLAGNPAAMRDPVIRDHLARSSSISVMRSLVSNALPADAPALFRRLMARHPHAALGLILDGELPEGAGIGADVLTPLLSHADHAIRMKAFLAVHRLADDACGQAQVRVTPPDPRPSGHASVRRAP